MEERITVALRALSQAACNEKETHQFYWSTYVGGGLGALCQTAYS